LQAEPVAHLPRETPDLRQFGDLRIGHAHHVGHGREDVGDGFDQVAEAVVPSGRPADVARGARLGGLVVEDRIAGVDGVPPAPEILAQPVAVGQRDAGDGGEG